MGPRFPTFFFFFFFYEEFSLPMAWSGIRCTQTCGPSAAAHHGRTRTVRSIDGLTWNPPVLSRFPLPHVRCGVVFWPSRSIGKNLNFFFWGTFRTSVRRIKCISLEHFRLQRRLRNKWLNWPNQNIFLHF